MKIFFSCSTIKFAQYKQIYYEIRDFLVAEGHTLTRDWLHNLKHNPREVESVNNGSEAIYQLTLAALHRADALIVENTVESFSNGHLITIALQRRIPILVLEQTTEPRYFPKTLIHGINDDYLQIKHYQATAYRELIRLFLHQSQLLVEKHHFHLVLSGVEKAYLDWLKEHTGQTHTTTIRANLKKQIQHDRQFREYLKNLS